MLETNTPSAMSLFTDRRLLVRRVLLGAFLGFAWGASLRAWMTVLAIQSGGRPHFTWSGTFGAILLPAALMGAVLGGAAYATEAAGSRQWRWAILSPLLLVVGPLLFQKDFINTLMTTGEGGGAIFVTLIGVLGGYAFSGFGARWMRRGFWLLTLFAIIAAVYFSSQAANPPDVDGIFVMLLFVVLLALLVIGVSVPSRQPAWPKLEQTK
jgi:hypothetical protein